MVYIIFTIFQRSKWENEIYRNSRTFILFYEISDFLFFISMLALSIILIFQLLYYLKSMIFFIFLHYSPANFSLLVCKITVLKLLSLFLYFPIDFPIFFCCCLCFRGQDNYNSLNINKNIYNLIFNLLSER